MFYLTLAITLLTAWFAKKEYDNARIEWAMFWAMLVGWDLHALLSHL